MMSEITCFGCSQPILSGDAMKEIRRDLLGRTWHVDCYEKAADGFLDDVRPKDQRPRHV